MLEPSAAKKLLEEGSPTSVLQPPALLDDDAFKLAPEEIGIERLGDDLLSEILTHVSPAELLTLSLSCRLFDRARCRANLPLRPRRSAFAGSLHLLRWACRHVGWLDDCALFRACEWAARAGCLPAIEWLRSEHGCPCGEDAVAAAAGGGHTELVRALVRNGCDADWRTPAAAAEGGHLECLRLVREELRLPWDELCAASAAGGGHLHVLRWAREAGCHWDGWTPAAAAAGGHIEVLEWLRMQPDPPAGGQVCAAAAGTGRLAALQWARAHGHRWDESCAAEAAGGGHLELLRWCRSVSGEACPWDESCCAAAAAGGHLELLRWCRSEGCPWDWQTLSAARVGRHAELEAWCRAHGCPEPLDGEGDLDFELGLAEGGGD